MSIVDQFARACAKATAPGQAPPCSIARHLSVASRCQQKKCLFVDVRQEPVCAPARSLGTLRRYFMLHATTYRLRKFPGLRRGADGETRTHTAFAATPSRWCVYQFHHVGKRRGFYRELPRPPHVHKPVQARRARCTHARRSSDPRGSRPFLLWNFRRLVRGRCWWGLCFGRGGWIRVRGNLLRRGGRTGHIAAAWWRGRRYGAHESAARST